MPTTNCVGCERALLCKQSMSFVIAAAMRKRYAFILVKKRRGSASRSIQLRVRGVAAETFGFMTEGNHASTSVRQFSN